MHLLQFSDRKLYDQFVLTQPWDGEHNKKLIPKMPEAYESPGEDLGEGKTCFLAVVAEGAIVAPGPPFRAVANLFGAGHRSEHAVIDGLSNTLLFVEAAPEEAVIWTKPDDWEIDPKRPTQGLFGMRRGGALVSFADASVRMVSDRVVEDVILHASGMANLQTYDLNAKKPKED